MSDEKKKSVGGLWLKKSQGGTNYMSGQVEVNGQKFNFTVFKNSFKDKDNQPDYVIYESTPKGDSAPQQKAAQKPVAKKPAPRDEEDEDEALPPPRKQAPQATPQKKRPPIVEEEDDGDVPF